MDLGWFKDLLPIGTALVGFAGGAIAFVPIVNKLKNDVATLQMNIERVWLKYRTGLAPTIAYDAKTLLRDADAVTETAADLLGRFKIMSKSERMLRDAIHQEWYQDIVK